MATFDALNGDDMSEALVGFLRQKARDKQLVTYREIAPLLGIDVGNEYWGVRVGNVLDEVNRNEFAENRPLLSAIVVLADTRQPGAGYYGCARELRRYRGSDFEEWVMEVGRVHDYWSRH